MTKIHERTDDGTWVTRDEPLVTRTGRVMTEVEIGLLSDLEAARHDLDQARIGFRAALGRADWLYDDELGVHIPCCSKMWLDSHLKRTVPCRNGPLTTPEQIASGDCGEHG